MHYARQKRHGSTDTRYVLQGATPRDRLDHGSETREECWVWVRFRDRKGYGKIQADGRFTGVHRYAYANLVDSDIDGWDIHHLCGVKACWRPEHLIKMHPSEHLSLHKARGDWGHLCQAEGCTTPPRAIGYCVRHHTMIREGKITFME